MPVVNPENHCKDFQNYSQICFVAARRLVISYESCSAFDLEVPCDHYSEYEAQVRDLVPRFLVIVLEAFQMFHSKKLARRFETGLHHQTI